MILTALRSHWSWWIVALAAHTVVIPDENMTAEKKAEINDLMSAARLMGEVCQRVIRPGNTNTQVTEVLATIAKAYDVHLLQGILMHQVGAPLAREA